MVYGKITDGALEYAPQPFMIASPVEIDGITHPAGAWLYTDKPDIIAKFGYKPIKYTDIPYGEGYEFTEAWVETETAIVQVWEEHEQPVKENLEEVIDILTGEVE